MSEQQTQESLFTQLLKSWGKAAEQMTQGGMLSQGHELFRQWQEATRKVV